MGVAIAFRQLDPVTPYRYVGGDQSLDFVNTVNWIEGGLDRFASYARLLEWAEGAQVVTRRTAGALRAVSEEYPARAVRVLSDAVGLRALLERLFFRISENRTVVSEIAQLNEHWLSTSLAESAVVVNEDNGLTLGWPRADTALESPLWAVARAAATLVTSADASSIRRCGGDGCGWYYVDRSRNGLRRWCEMETCGTKMKSRRRAERNAAAHQGGTPR
ncbi:MAG: CGNR zinc finger domain-containing protein [Gemmatimonadaceae bacterium]